MLAKQGGKEMGQRSHLTQLDIQKLNRLYYCGTSPPLPFYSVIPLFMGVMFTKVTLWFKMMGGWRGGGRFKT